MGWAGLRGHPLLYLVLLGAVLLGAGIGAATGLTGKDEFFLGLRTPMEMMAGDHWLVPFLDEAPRIKKPPLLYWLGRAGFEVFGPSLLVARAIAVGFAILLLLSAYGIASRLAERLLPEQDARQVGGYAALILLACLGLHSEGRRFMLDVPTAALSAAALWSFLYWQAGAPTGRVGQARQGGWLWLSVLLLAAGALVKGPVVAIVFGSACLALALTPSGADKPKLAWPGLGLSLGLLALLLLLVLPWFFWVRHAYPAASTLALDDEMASRQFLHFGPANLLALISLSLPWGFVLLQTLWQRRAEIRRPGWLRFCLLWLLFSSLPFVFMRSFDRYLIGSLLPLAVLLAPVALAGGASCRLGLRLGMLLSVLVGGGFTALALCLGPSPRAALSILPVALAFVWLWWRTAAPRPGDEGQAGAAAPGFSPVFMLMPALFWMVFFWLVFPALGINAVPESVVARARQQPVAFFEGPQPAMLPILSGQAHRQFAKLDAQAAARLAEAATPIFAEAGAADRLAAEAAAQGYALAPQGSFSTLATHGSGLRFVREGAGLAAWREALSQGRPDPLMTRIDEYRLYRP